MHCITYGYLEWVALHAMIDIYTCQFSNFNVKGAKGIDTFSCNTAE